MSPRNPAAIARDAFAASAIDLLRRALADGLGAHVLVDANGVMTHADLHDATGAVLVHLTLGEPRAAQVALPLAGPVEAAVPLERPAPPAPAVEAHPLAIGDRILLDGVAVEVLGVDDEGFVWREIDPDAVALDEGETLWRDVTVSWSGNVWVARKIAEAPVEEPPPVVVVKPAKKSRAKKAPAKAAPAVHPRAVLGRWTLVEGYTDGTDDEVYSWPNEANARDMMANAREADICTHATLIDPRGVVVDTYTAAATRAAEAAAAPWRLVEHPIGAAPRETPCDVEAAHRLFAAAAQYASDLRRVELFDGDGLLVDSHTWPVSLQSTRGLDGVSDTVPAHLRDAVALTSPD